MKLVVFFHSLFELGEPPEMLPAALEIVYEIMFSMKTSGLEDAASEIHAGVNGGQTSKVFAESLLPAKAQVTYHGTACRNEIRTLLMLEQWLQQNAGEAYILWCHAKGSTHPPGDEMRTRWRQCMSRNLVHNWRQCVADLESYESVGCHFMTGDQTPPGQSIWAGNWWWCRASFLRTLPSILDRERIKISGIDSLESRYEPEVWISNGSRLPTIKDYHGPRWNPGQIGTCTP